ncbi:conserved hypothetical protein [Leishmania major strain Friedlin]|uniref:Uncharacterized protein n=1 Tax=Leishmania major TaxID=5664 RepID=Q4Q479_LEIMA|nr:conserved hypothetical protein [Leishmania major strain Friedlin]CAG9580685.1 hypothetical_protein_-_conserved [Leishmania major strain Friedlin]CAJ06221.1 conserved hypothetical protein [Leishmania major strain Friedlin]|eukprot:XP_001685869.1 conserved hypothetical protein [Leishmania major strain Friedlin]
MCFACSRCEYPICDSSTLLLRKVRQGPSEYAFHYNLDGLLDLEEVQVPCYSAAEVVHTSAVVSESLMKFPMPPAALVVALESIVQSRKHWIQQRQSMNARLHERGVAALPATSAEASIAAVTSGTASSVEGTLSTPADVSRGADAAPVAATTTAASNAPIVRRYGDTAESRIDLVCVKDSVLAGGVQECTKDRSAVATTVVSPEGQGAEDGAESAAHREDGVVRSALATAPAVIRDASFANIQADVMKAATAAAAETSWTSPGNFRLREAFIDVSRTTLSSRAPWFQDYKCVSRVQCPDCHQPLGFVFCVSDSNKQQQQRSSSEAAGPLEATLQTQGVKRPATSEADETGSIDDTATPPDAVAVQHSSAGPATAPVTEVTQLPHAKKTRNEKDAQAAASASTRHTWQEARLHRQRNGAEECQGKSGNEAEDREDGVQGGADEADDDDAEAAPDRFVGLELKRIVQRQWTLSVFHERYSKSRQLQTFRELFPEAEELQSLYSRLLGLRTQTELYSSLLRRHKEQNDVQMALLMSNKDRMHTYDEKVKTMQQIIEAQRAQIAMQTRQIRNQEELVQSHRRQFATQKRQMDVEQLLLVQQSKTIESQKEQLRLLKNHFQATRPEVLLDARLRGSPCPPPLLSRGLPSGTGGIEPSQAVQAAQSLRQLSARGRYREEAEHDWTDAEEGEEEGGGEGDGRIRKTVAPSASLSVAPLETPPAHLCGVPTSSASRHGVTPSENDQTLAHTSLPLSSFGSERGKTT